MATDYTEEGLYELPPSDHLSPYEQYLANGGNEADFWAEYEQVYNSPENGYSDPNYINAPEGFNWYQPDTWTMNDPAAAPTPVGTGSTGGGSFFGPPGPTSTGGGGTSGGGGGGGGFSMPSWQPPEGFGVRPSPFGETYTTLPRPDWLQGPYRPPTWGENFTAPTMADLQAEPGYQSRLAAGQLARERSAAAQGSILSGGTQKALERYGQDFASNEYANVFGRAFQQYQQRYGEFGDMANRDALARGFNEGTYQSDVSNNLNQYNTRYKAYLDAITNNRNYDNDIFNRNLDTARLGLSAGSLAG